MAGPRRWWQVDGRRARQGDNRMDGDLAAGARCSSSGSSGRRSRLGEGGVERGVGAKIRSRIWEGGVDGRG